MPGIKYFPTDTKIENKIILLRLDLNVPLKDKKIQDDTRIVQALSFLDYLVQKKAKIVVISHLGRPEGSRDKNLSLMPIYKYLKEKLETNIYFFTGEILDLIISLSYITSILWIKRELSISSGT